MTHPSAREAGKWSPDKGSRKQRWAVWAPSQSLPTTHSTRQERKAAEEALGEPKVGGQGERSFSLPHCLPHCTIVLSWTPVSLSINWGKSTCPNYLLSSAFANPSIPSALSISVQTIPTFKQQLPHVFAWCLFPSSVEPIGLAQKTGSAGSQQTECLSVNCLVTLGESVNP